MPEGDSLFRAARTLHRALAGKPVVRFQTALAQLSRVDDDAPIAGRTVERVRSVGKHLLVEFSDVSAESADTTTSALADDLSRFGYEVFRYDPDRVALDPVGSYLRGNLVASKRIDELRSRLSH